MVITALLFALLRKSRKNADFQRLSVLIVSFFQNLKPSLRVHLHPRPQHSTGQGYAQHRGGPVCHHQQHRPHQSHRSRRLQCQRNHLIRLWRHQLWRQSLHLRKSLCESRAQQRLHPRRSCRFCLRLHRYRWQIGGYC